MNRSRCFAAMQAMYEFRDSSVWVRGGGGRAYKCGLCSGGGGIFAIFYQRTHSGFDIATKLTAGVTVTEREHSVVKMAQGGGGEGRRRLNTYFLL